ncbi:MAG: IclR family transcriptional regulator [Syntrophorhabdaceae bacterium]|nr:IclR family transcriptional regulator [Syntrophorhabdaceae bacterium]
MEKSQYTIKVLEKAIRILDCYTHGENSFTLDEITKRTKLSKPTVFRILKTLEQNGFLRYTKTDETYRLGLRLLDLGSIVYTSSPVRKPASKHLDHLSETLKYTILVGVILDGQFMYIDKREMGNGLKLPAYLGARRRPEDNALGMILLAHMEEELREEILKEGIKEKGLKKAEARLAKITERLTEARIRGYYIEHGEFIDGISSIAVPIWGHGNKVVAALGVSLPTKNTDGIQIDAIIRELIHTSNLISEEIKNSTH